MKNKYDIIIIGSGIGGLASAALLSKEGKSVLVVEKEPRPGGYLNEFRSGDFIFDVSLHLLNGCNKDGYVNNMFKKCGILNDIKFIKPKYLYRSIFPDLDIKIPQGNIETHREVLKKHFPDSKKAIDSFFNDMLQLLNDVASSGNGSRITPLLISHLKDSAGSVINRYFKNERLKAVIYQLWMYLGLPPSKLRAVDFCFPWADYSFNGGFYPEKGSYAIAKALADRIKENGGKLLLGKEVSKILVKNGRCEGVTVDNKEIMCDAVIANSDLRTTLSGLVGRDEIGASNFERLENIEPSISAIEIFMGLNIDLKDKYPDDFEIFVNSCFDIEKQYKYSLDNDSRLAPFAIGIYSNVNRFAAPIGKSVVTIVMLAGYDYWKDLPHMDYEKEKERISNILIERAGKIIPELLSNLKKKIVSTPLTFQRYTNNSKGSIYGYVSTSHGKLEVRPNDAIGIKNLYFASSWARQGSGVMKVLRSAEDVYRKIASPTRNHVQVKVG